ncbi:MAG: hypothetical protein QOG63_1831, partial [Thermoleophilaceae bacterium]|nr:hypothetical protein [Thermoleophilaceae bacterium]
MRRAPIVLSATVAGVAGVLSFHAQPQQLTPVPPATTAQRSTTTSTRSGTKAKSGSAPAT